MNSIEWSDKKPGFLDILVLVMALLVAWAGINAVWGMTSVEPTMFSNQMSDMAPLPYWLCSALTLLLLLALVGVQRKDVRLVVPITMLLTYVLGVTGAEYAQNWIGPEGPVAHRLFFLAPAVPMLLVWLSFPQHRTSYPLRIGDWSPADPHWPLPVKILSLAAVVTVGVRLAIDIHLLSGDWWPNPATIVAVSTLNGFSEELLFRGLIFPALMIAAGLRWGILLQALFFGFLHFGASESWIGNLGSAIALVALGALFSFFVVRRNGLAWVVGVHALIDIIGLSLLSLSRG